MHDNDASPVVWSDELGGWVVRSRELCVSVMRDFETFTVDHPNFTTAQVIGRSMLSTDGPEHQAQRKPFVAPFDRPTTDSVHQPALAVRAHRLIETMRESGSAELRSSVATPMAIGAILGALDMDVSIPQMAAWYEAIVGAVDALSGGQIPPGDTSIAELDAAIRDTAKRSASILHHVDGPNLVSNTMVLLFGAIETGDGMIANLLWHLLTNADELRRVRASGDLRNALEESLRLEPAASRVDRFATTDLKLAGQAIAAGDLVIVSLRDANRDASVFEDPSEFQTDRSNARSHLAFAVGPHACLGAHFARAEALAAVEACLTLPDLSLISTTKPEGLIFRKPPALHATWSTGDEE